MLTALLDTCVLWSSPQRDALLPRRRRHVPAGLEQRHPRRTYEEAAKLTRRGADRTDADRRAAYLIQPMRRAFSDAEITGWESLEGAYGLPDRDDEHVVAAAVVSGAGAIIIITLNTKDFPAALLPFGLETLRPAEFAANTVSLDPHRALHAIRTIANRTGTHGPGWSVTELLDLLVRRYGFDDAVDQLLSVE
jgi:hypothetical protein